MAKGDKGKVVQVIFRHPLQKRLVDFYIWYEDEHEFYSYCDVGKLYYTKNMIKNLIQVNFRHATLPCPNPEEYFSLRYGEDWRTPKKVSGLPGGGWEITKNLIRG